MRASPLVVDTDPGLDDALALTYLIDHHGVDLITTVAGNKSLSTVTNNALHIVNALDKAPSVYQGARRPLEADQVTNEFHGPTGLGSQRAPSRTANDLHSDVIPGHATIIGLGPATNIAHLLQHTDASQYDVILFAGTQGPTTYDGAEFNAYADPHALQQVLKSEASVTLVTLDALTENCPAVDDVPSYDGSDVIETVWQDFKATCSQHGFTFEPYDLFVAYLATHPGLYRAETRRVTVETNAPSRGETQIKDGDQISVVTAVADTLQQRGIQALHDA